MSAHLKSRFSVLYAIVLVVSVLVVVSPAQQGGKKDDDKPQNLKVLDTNMTHDEVMVFMNKFTNGLGVGCDHCHAVSKTDPEEMDFPSDDNKVKLTARTMLEMVNKINGSLLTNLPTSTGSEHIMVECVTCHRGQPKPIMLQDLLMQVRKEHGMAAFDSTYRELRNEYYGGFTYDFGERTLGQVAQKVADENHADALTILRLNQEFNPKSAYTQWAMGRVHTMMGDTASAIDAFKRALEINPEYRRAKRELETLTGGGKK